MTGAEGPGEARRGAPRGDRRRRARSLRPARLPQSGALRRDRGEGRSHPGRDPVPLRFEGSLAAGGDRRARPTSRRDLSPTSPSTKAWRRCATSCSFAELSEQRARPDALHAVLVVESYDTESPTHAYFQRTQPLRARVGGEHAARRASGRARSAPTSTAPRRRREFIAFLEGAAAMWLLDRSVSLVGLYESYIDTFIAAVREPRLELTVGTVRRLRAAGFSTSRIGAVELLERNGLIREPWLLDEVVVVVLLAPEHEERDRDDTDDDHADRDR